MTVSSQRRLFLGIALPGDILRPLEAFQTQYKDLPGIRWVRGELLHITAYFFGEIAEEMGENLLSLIQISLKGHQSFHLDFDQYCYAPPRKEPRMIWARYQKQEAFRSLSTSLHEAFLPIRPEQQYRKSPIPHITLARLRGFDEFDAIEFPWKRLPGLQVEQLVLWESILSPEGPEYTEVERFVLER